METWEERFWSKVCKQDNGCWEWLASKDRDGYGRFKIGKRTPRAHRVSWSLHVGSVPKGMLVCHTCDNPSCVNPAHLFLGTADDNSKDKLAKHREARGSTAGKSKLTKKDVLRIREWYASGRYTCPAIAKIYGMTRQQIRNIIAGRSWAWLS